MRGISSSQPAKGVCPSHLLGAVFAFMLFANIFRSCRLMAHEPPEHASFFLVTKKERIFSLFKGITVEQSMAFLLATVENVSL